MDSYDDFSGKQLRATVLVDFSLLSKRKVRSTDCTMAFAGKRGNLLHILILLKDSPLTLPKSHQREVIITLIFLIALVVFITLGPRF